MKTHLAASAIALMGTQSFAQDLSNTLPDSVASVAPALQSYAAEDLFGTVWNAETLSVRDRALVTFAAMVTRHEADQLGRLVYRIRNRGRRAACLRGKPL